MKICYVELDLTSVACETFESSHGHSISVNTYGFVVVRCECERKRQSQLELGTNMKPIGFHLIRICRLPLDGMLLQIDVALVQLNEIASVTFRWWFKGRSIFRCLRSRCRPIRLRQYWQRPMMLVGGKKWSERYWSDETVSLRPTVIQFPPGGDNKWILIENSLSSLKKNSIDKLAPANVKKFINTDGGGLFKHISELYFLRYIFKRIETIWQLDETFVEIEAILLGIVSIGRKDVVDGKKDVAVVDGIVEFHVDGKSFEWFSRCP